ncbi:hypothetical protein ACG9YX_20880, partial [Acinetobacter nematophilus]
MNHDYIELIDQYYARLGKGFSVFFCDVDTFFSSSIFFNIYIIKPFSGRELIFILDCGRSQFFTFVHNNFFLFLSNF